MSGSVPLSSIMFLINENVNKILSCRIVVAAFVILSYLIFMIYNVFPFNEDIITFLRSEKIGKNISRLESNFISTTIQITYQ